MNSIVNKKFFFSVVFLTLCGFAFAQNIRVVGIIPKTDTGKMYQLQIGAFSLAVNVNKAAEILTKNGFVPQFEKKGNLTRVFIVVKAVDVRGAVDRLGRAGFKEVVIREYSGKSADIKTVEVTPSEPKPAEPKEPETAVFIEEEIPDEDLDFEIVEEIDFELEIEEEIDFEPEDIEIEDEDIEIETGFEIPVFDTEEPKNDLMHILE